MIVVVTGSRDWNDHWTVEQALIELAGGDDPSGIVLVEGGARGLDRIVRIAGRFLGFNVQTVEADWETNGKSAGPIRNQEMIDLQPDLGLAFPLGHSIGTFDMMMRMKANGIPYQVFFPRESVHPRDSRFDNGYCPKQLDPRMF